jgi:hypothetical protein
MRQDGGERPLGGLALWLALTRALKRLDDVAAGRSGDHAGLTALEDRLGLTPKGRRALSSGVEHVPAAPVVQLTEARADPGERA